MCDFNYHQVNNNYQIRLSAEIAIEVQESYDRISTLVTNTFKMLMIVNY